MAMNATAPACDWRYESVTKRCKQPAVTVNPPTGLRYCAIHTQRFHGLEYLVPIDLDKPQAKTVSKCD